MTSILWIEDDVYSLFEPMMHEFLKVGYKVSSATNKKEALNLLENNSFDLIILDILLPSGDAQPSEFRQFVGMDLLEELVARGIKTPVMIFSIVTDKEIIEKANKLGVKDFINKGHITPRELKDYADRCLNAR